MNPIRSAGLSRPPLGPHPEEAALLGGRLEGWPPARSRLRPSFEMPASRAPQDEDGRMTSIMIRTSETQY